MLISTSPQNAFFSSFLFFSLAATWNVLFSCLKTGKSQAPHFPGDQPLLPWSVDIIGGHCATHVHLSLKDKEAAVSAQTQAIGLNVSV